MDSTTREHSARVTRARLRDLQNEITTFANQSSSGSGRSNRSGNEERKTTDDTIEKGDWLEVLEPRIAHLESVVASICNQAHDCSVFAKAERIERWLSTMCVAHAAPKASEPLPRTRMAR